MYAKTWSYSVLKDYESCPHRLKLKSEGAPSPAFEKNRGTLVHEAAESFVRGTLSLLPPELHRFKPQFEELKAHFNEGAATVEEEWGFDFDWGVTSYNAPDVWLRVKTDAFIRIDDGAAVIIDWKTGKSFQNAVPHMQQAQLYALTAMMKYPDVQAVETRFAYLDEGKTTKKLFTREDLPRLLANYERRSTTMFTDVECKPKPNRMNCRFCKYGVTNGSDACGFAIPWE